MEKRFIGQLLIIFVFCLFWISNIGAQNIRQNNRKKTNVERFILSPFIEAADEDSIRIITFIEIPFNVLSFIKKEDYYLASYEVSVSIKEKNKNEFGHIVWSDSIKLSDYEETNSFIRNRKHFTSFIVPTGNTYEILAELQDNDTRKKGLIKNKIESKNHTKTPQIIKPNFFLELSGDWGFEYGKIPTKGYRVREIGDGVDLQISGFVDTTIYSINVYLNNNEFIDSLIWNIERKDMLGFFNETIFIPSKVIMASENDFRIVLDQNGKSIEQKVNFSNFRSGMSAYAPNLEIALKQMKYVLTNTERNLLKKEAKKSKEALFLKLWKDRDPTPKTDTNELMDEYYRRVRYADENFDGWKKGWESDRGMIYILFGPPDEIQRSSVSVSNNTSLQIWKYYDINKQFVFRDENGFGEYRLDNPFFSGEF